MLIWIKKYDNCYDLQGAWGSVGSINPDSRGVTIIETFYRRYLSWNLMGVMNSKSLTQCLMWIMWLERKRERGRNWVDSATYWVWFTSVLNLVFFLLPHHCMHTWPWPLALNPTAGALSRHRHDRRGRKAELERGAWRRLMLALLSWQQQDGLEAPLPGAAPLAHHRFQSLWGEVKVLDRSPNNTGGASG